MCVCVCVYTPIYIYMYLYLYIYQLAFTHPPSSVVSPQSLRVKR